MTSLDGAALEHAHAKEVRPWLDLIDELRQHGISQDIPLPQIAVMGDQSSGKSSVLEAISGVPFPRGGGLVTRCATQLIMKAAPAGTEWSARASVTGSKNGIKGCGDVQGGPEALTKIIADLQNGLTSGNTSAFSSESIVIEVRAPGLPDLTLIDLPGIVRTATSGQSANVMNDVNSMVERYLAQERTIILAVVPSNQDVATVDILERAKRVDPEGDRTIGVLTKPDLIGPGNEDEVIAVLRNIRKPLKLGYVMVKCRSQIDINTGMSNKSALVAEQKFFRDNMAFAGIPSGSLGIQCLTSRLTDLLVKRIGNALPAIKWELQTQLGQVESELAPMIKGVPHDSASCHTSFMRIVSDYCRLLRQSARGYYRDDLLSSKPNLRLHADCQVIFKGLHADIADTMPGFNDPGFGERLATEITSLRGRELPGFLNLQVFYGFMVQNVETWRPAVERCSSQVANASLSIASLLIQALAIQFPKLCGAIRDCISGLVEQLAEEVSTKIDHIFQKESDPFTTNEGMLEVINTIRFRNFDTALEEALVAAGEKPAEALNLMAPLRESLGGWYMKNHGVGTMANVEDMCTLLQAYWNVATKRLVDNVCMTMEQDFIVNLLGLAENELFLLAARIGNVEELFVEDAAVMEKRRGLQSKRERLVKGMHSLRRMAPEIVAEPSGDSAEHPAKLTQDLSESSRWTRKHYDPDRQAYFKTEEGQLSALENTERLPQLGEVRSTWGGATWHRERMQKTLHSQPDHYNMPVRPNPYYGATSLQQQQLLAKQQQQMSLQRQQQRTKVQPVGVSQDVLVSRLMDIGFSGQQAQVALQRNDNDPDRAAEWLVNQQAASSDMSNSTQNIPIPVLQPTISHPSSMATPRSYFKQPELSYSRPAQVPLSNNIPNLEDFLSSDASDKAKNNIPAERNPPRVMQSKDKYSTLFGDENPSMLQIKNKEKRGTRPNTSSLFEDTT